MTAQRWLQLAGGAAWSLGVLVTARPPSAGAGWRLAFVACALAGVLWAGWTLRTWRPSPFAVIAISFALRAAVFPLNPALSDDGYRYLWDGMVQVGEGTSPYRFRPSDPALAHHHEDAAYRRMNSPDYFSVYPPLSQAVFAAAGAVYGAGWRASWWVLKALIVAAEMVGVVCLIRVVGARAAALYAWHPLAVIEVAGQGHTEGLLVGALGVLLWDVARHPALAGAAVAAAGWVKLYPFALGAVVVQRVGWRGTVSALAVAVVLALPYTSAEAARHATESLRLYMGTFDFYSAPYLLLKGALYHSTSEPGLVAARLLGVAGVVWAGWVVATQNRSVTRTRWAVAALVMGFTLTSTTLHPWHLLPGLFVLPLLLSRKSYLWLSAVTSATYLVYVWPPAYTSAVWAGWGGAVVLFSFDRLEALMRYRAWGKWRRLRPYVPVLRPGARVLDLGAGEGYVGDALAADLGVAVTAADVVHFGSGSRRVDLYDGQTLPYASGQFDLTVVVFVLHHSADPAAVLREAVRVTGGVVLVLETVWTAPWQKAWLERADRLANRLRSGAAIDEEPLDIRSDAEWRSVLREEGVAVRRTRTFAGLHPQALYVLDGHGAAASSTS
ncbi:methyltransferase domain-containing protein [Rubrivirga sp. S365]|uniref:Methyltransferase domain-containing protein n=1 Tax=Rubrivirga litoralis TaxID=3075598 RepID=A0ABU3BTR0_9BACT|nr:MULTISPECIES: methyltransferase domain-containing protein [unclassified Rubrivirga]MDT0632672.1 methyltransferase domain-containing protein [Rubrivirga sp. F394]MDT7857151.1 methyltransferase domain-containing protein [Rubrivirga sp. S365]